MKIKTQITILVLVIILSFLYLCNRIMISQDQISDVAKDIQIRVFQKSVLAGDVNHLGYQIIQNYLKDNAAGFIESSELNIEIIKNIKEKIMTIKDLSTEEDMQFILSIKKSLDELIVKGDELLVSMEDQDWQLNGELSDEFNKIGSSLLKYATDLKETERTLLDNRINLITSKFKEQKKTITINLIVILILAILFSVLIIVGISRNIGTVMKFTDRIAKGDFSVQVNPKGNNEFRQLGKSLVLLTEIIKGITAESSNISSNIAKGNLDIRGDEAKFEGEFKKVVQSLNSALDEISLIQGVIKILKEVAQGNYDNELDGEFEGEFHVLQTSLNKMIQSLKESDLTKQLLNDLKIAEESSTEISIKIVESASKLNSSSEKGIHSSIMQAGKVESIIASIEYMHSSINNIAENSSKVTALSEDNSSVATTGLEKVKTLIMNIDGIRLRVSDSDKNMKRLLELNGNIEEVIGVIVDVADQTNLLALNAAIEAARAGEQGRGFAVVADEVRKLADRSKESIAGIQEFVQDIKTQSRDVMNSMLVVDNLIEENSVQSKYAVDALENTCKVAKEVSEAMTEIVAVVEEQTAVASEISDDMHQVEKATDEVAKISENVAIQAHELNALAVELKNIKA